MKRHLKTNLTILVFTLLFMLYNNNSLILDYKDNKLLKRDSSQIFYTLENWHKNNFSYWGITSDLEINHDDISYSPCGIFYSPDSLKMIIWILEKKKNAEFKVKYSDNPIYNRICPIDKDTIYSITSLIAYRKTKHRIWEIYELSNRIVTCCENDTSGIDDMKNYYFKNFKNDVTHVDIRNIDNSYGGKVFYEEYKADTLKYKKDENYLVLKEYGYNLNDDGFWDKSLLWQKGARIKDYYVFQSNNLRLITKPEIVYPKEILELFNK